MTSLRRPGLRFLAEAFVIVLTAVVTGLAHVGAWGIGGAVAVVWVFVAVLEYSLSHPRDREKPASSSETLAGAQPAAGEAVRVLPRAAAPVPVPVADESVADERVAAAAAAAAQEPVPEPEAAPEQQPEPIVAAPEPEPEPEREPEPESELAGTMEWNLWELDRAVHERGEATEEQEFLLLYLRDHAGPDGSLPADFDDLVRESFGDVLGTPAG